MKPYTVKTDRFSAVSHYDTVHTTPSSTWQLANHGVNHLRIALTHIEYAALVLLKFHSYPLLTVFIDDTDERLLLPLANRMRSKDFTEQQESSIRGRKQTIQHTRGKQKHCIQLFDVGYVIRQFRLTLHITLTFSCKHLPSRGLLHSLKTVVPVDANEKPPPQLKEPTSRERILTFCDFQYTRWGFHWTCCHSILEVNILFDLVHCHLS